MTRACVSHRDLPAFVRAGWRIVFRLPQPIRGTDWLIERGENVEVA